MNISGISGNMSANFVSGASSASGGRLEDQLQSLQDAIASGDIDAVQKTFDEISQKTSGYGDDPIGQFLSSVEDALANGDLTALEEASETFASFEPPELQGGFASPPPQPLGTEAGNAFSSLIEALNSSDEEAAESAYGTLIETLSQNDSDADTDNPLKTALADVGTALSSGDLTAAQTNLNQVLSSLPNGVLFDVSV